MEKPNIRIIDQQSEEVNDVNDHEAQELLRKYGYFDTQGSVGNTNVPIQDECKLSFEEMVERQRLEEESKKKSINKPNPITFNSNGYDYERKSVSEDGISFTIEITTDMNIPKRY